MSCLYLVYYHLVFITAVAMVTGFRNSSPALRPIACTVSGWWMMLFIDAECVTCRDVLTVLLVSRENRPQKANFRDNYSYNCQKTWQHLALDSSDLNR